jgi:hypothetical protein
MVLASLMMASCSMARVEKRSTSRSRSVGLATASAAAWSPFCGGVAFEFAYAFAVCGGSAGEPLAGSSLRR